MAVKSLRRWRSLPWTNHFKAVVVGLIGLAVTRSPVGAIAMFVATEVMFDWDKRSYQELQAKLSAAQVELIRLRTGNAQHMDETIALESLVDETLMALVMARESIPESWGEQWMRYLEPYLQMWSDYRNQPLDARGG